MGPKLVEMDNVIKSVYEHVLASSTSTAVFILGDHGMTDSGNHGGSSPEETNTACLVLMNRVRLPERAAPKVIDQLDIAPIIASLFGVPIPEGSVGRVELSLLHSLSPETRMKHLLNNLSQLVGGGAAVAVDDAVDCYRSNCTATDCGTCISMAEAKIGEAQGQLSSNFGTYNLPVLLACLAASLGSIVLMLCRGSFSATVLLPTVLYCVSIFSSSFIEEEHEIWNHLVPVLIVAAANTSLPSKMAALLAARVLRTWNSNGYEHRSLPDMKMFLANHPSLMSLLLLGTLVYYSRSGALAVQLFKLLLAGLVFAYKLDWTTGPSLGRAIISGASLLALFDAQSLHLLLMAVQKSHNALPLVLLDQVGRAVTHPDAAMALLHHSYFSLGMSNLVTSIDLSNSYIGLTDYRPAWVALVTFVVSFSGPIHALAAGGCRMNLAEVAVRRAAVQFSVMLCCFVQRHHISVWTVFTPRLLFEALWTAFYILSALFYTKTRLINK